MALATKPLDASTWSDFAQLAEEHHGVWDGCWCLGFHEEGRNGVHTPAQRRALKEARVRGGRAHAALVFDDGRCVGWCQYGPTEELPRIKHQKAYQEGLRELPDWRITCFFVGRTHRHRGVADAALAGALVEIARLGGGTVESYPEDTSGRKVSESFLHNGNVAMFDAMGSLAAGKSANTAGWSAGSLAEPEAACRNLLRPRPILDPHALSLLS